MGKGMGGHQSANMITGEWLTPPEIISALGTFDLDPCVPKNRPWDTAKNHYSEGGLEKPWYGRVWCNPPYGLIASEWMKKMAQHGKGTALLFARTETKMFFESVWPKASAVLFIQGRIHFHYVDGTKAKGNSGAPSVLISYGQVDALILEKSGIKGKFIRLKGERW